MVGQAPAMQRVETPAVTFCYAFPQSDTVLTGPGAGSLTVVTTSAAVTAGWRVLAQAQPRCCD